MIIELDSLVRLNKKDDDITQKKYVPNYDLIVVDEMEGILSHFNAKTLKTKQITCDILTQVLKETNKIICLDGDLQIRNLDYLENTIKKNINITKTNINH